MPPPRPESWNNAGLEALGDRALELIRQLSDLRRWGWKDPRTCLTMPFWRSLLPDLRTVIIVRNPLEVAYSMHQRNGTSYAFGLRLWEIYNRQLLAHIAARSRIVTHYQIFFENPEAELSRLARFTGLPEAETAAVARLVVRDRRHTSFTTEQLIDAGASEQLVALYRSQKEARTK